MPKGSILGADLYSDYTVPLGDLLRILKKMYNFYADDSQLLKVIDPSFSDEHINAVISLQDNIMSVGKWMKSNKFKLNEDKTEFQVIGSILGTDGGIVKHYWLLGLCNSWSTRME